MAEIVSRWMVNQVNPSDVRNLKTIVNFNSYIARIWVDQLARDLLTSLYGKEPYHFSVKTKGELKDFVIQNLTQTSPRIKKMVAKYKRFPEDFYRETPFDGRVYYNEEQGNPTFVATTRIKRFRRIAEKGSRRIIDFMFDRVRFNADLLAEERAQQLGITKSQLITPPAKMDEEFRHAERRLIKSIKQGTIQSELPILSIPDVVGIKLLAEGDQYRRLLEILESNPTCKLLEEERHTGNYNATNLRLAHVIPKALLASLPPTGKYLRVLASRGFDPKTVEQQYLEFLDEAEDHILLEIIVSSYPEFLESEVGRSMHEERVLQQRANNEYKSHMARNVRYLMDYLLGLCLAPDHEGLMDVPIKLWVKYMPDTVDWLIRDLYSVPSDSSFDGATSTTAAAPVVPIQGQMIN